MEDSLRWKNPAALEPFRLLNRAARWEILPDATREEIQPWMSVIHDPHDAPILAVAVAARPERFVTLDVKHWIEPPKSPSAAVSLSAREGRSCRKSANTWRQALGGQSRNRKPMMGTGLRPNPFALLGDLP